MVGESLRSIMSHRSITIAEAAKILHVKPFQVRRLLAGENAMTLRTLQSLAEAFRLEPYQLLVCDLDPANPQNYRVLSPADEKVLKAVDEARKSGPQ